MRLRGVSWLAVKTADFDRTTSFFRETLGLATVAEDSDFAVFRLPDGDLVEVFGPSGPDHPRQFEHSPVAAGFLVPDIDVARRELQQAGVELVGEIERDPKNGLAWQMFLGPEGLLYELVLDPSHR